MLTVRSFSKMPRSQCCISLPALGCLDAAGCSAAFSHSTGSKHDLQSRTLQTSSKSPSVLQLSVLTAILSCHAKWYTPPSFKCRLQSRHPEPALGGSIFDYAGRITQKWPGVQEVMNTMLGMKILPVFFHWIIGISGTWNLQTCLKKSHSKEVCSFHLSYVFNHPISYSFVIHALPPSCHSQAIHQNAEGISTPKRTFLFWLTLDSKHCWKIPKIFQESRQLLSLGRMLHG